VYTYVLTVAPGDQDRLSAGTATSDTTPASANDVQPAQLNQNLLDSFTSIPGGFNQPPSAG
jgi:hypothetical protein